MIMNIGNDMEELIGKIDDILSSLKELEGKYDYSFAEKYQGNDFSNQMELAVKMENLVHQISHEMCSEIAFLKEDIIELHRYIEFRKKYSMLSESELLLLIDGIGECMSIKKRILGKLASSKWMEVKKRVDDDWQNLFGNCAFEKVNSKFVKNE